MPVRCAISGCKNALGCSPISFFSFPLQNYELLKRWLSGVKLRKNLKISRKARICQDHFDSRQIIQRKGRRILEVGAVPIPSLCPRPSQLHAETVAKYCQAQVRVDQFASSLARADSALDGMSCTQLFHALQLVAHLHARVLANMAPKLQAVSDPVSLPSSASDQPYQTEARDQLSSLLSDQFQSNRDVEDDSEDAVAKETAIICGAPCGSIEVAVDVANSAEIDEDEAGRVLTTPPCSIDVQSRDVIDVNASIDAENEPAAKKMKSEATDTSPAFSEEKIRIDPDDGGIIIPGFTVTDGTKQTPTEYIQGIPAPFSLMQPISHARIMSAISSLIKS